MPTGLGTYNTHTISNYVITKSVISKSNKSLMLTSIKHVGRVFQSLIVLGLWYADVDVCEMI